MYELAVILFIFICLSYFLYSQHQEKFDDNCEKIVIHKIRFNNDGYKIGLIGGVHGNEPAGAVALSEIISGKWALPAIGEYIIIPEANKCGLLSSSRYQNTFTNRDLNRNFSESGPLDYNAQTVLSAFSDCDYIIDIHEGYAFHKQTPESVGSTLTSTPGMRIITDNAVNTINKNINENWRKFTSLQENCDIKGTLSCLALHNNRNYVLIEVTGQNDIQPITLRVNQIKFLINNMLHQIYNIQN
jgi:predicted deacylase